MQGEVKRNRNIPRQKGTDNLIGELGGLACAPLWAISTILIKSQTNKVDALRINALRSVFGSIFLIAIFPVFGKIDMLGDLSFSAVAYLWLSVLIGLVLGDTLYIKGMGIVGAARALPISITYPIFVLPFSITIIGEDLSRLTIVGVLIAVAGLYIITAPKRGAKEVPAETRRQYWWGIFLLLAASSLWAISTTILNFSMIELEPIVAAVIRMPFMALALWIIVFLKKDTRKAWYPGRKPLLILALAGILGIGMGGFLFMVGIKYAGPAKTAILSATTPLFGLPLSVVMLRERITLRMVVGTILCIVGIWFAI